MSGLVSRFKAANSLLYSKNPGKKITAFFLASALAATGMTAIAKEQDNIKPGTTHTARTTPKDRAAAPQQQVEIPENPAAYEFFIKRTVRLAGEVNAESATRIAMQLKMLDDLKGGDITLIINSPGGSVSDGMAIYDAIKSLKNDVRTVCEGQCASMGAFILSSGTKGKRSAAPNAIIMIHQPSGSVSGQASDVQISANEILYIRKHMTELLSRNMDVKFQDVAELLERDYSMTAERAVELGLIDKIDAPRKPLEPMGTRHIDSRGPGRLAP
ncbi:MAG: ATP-dependent Clp protease proteolytic subunit ClpP [Micavibrio sp.]|nr:ATP-dependent Clp protease proteolytic subunit ClpP [Micavibrio sp.]